MGLSCTTGISCVARACQIDLPCDNVDRSSNNAGGPSLKEGWATRGNRELVQRVHEDSPMSDSDFACKLEIRRVDGSGYPGLSVSHKLFFRSDDATIKICPFFAGSDSDEDSDPFEVDKYGQFQAWLFASADELIIDVFLAYGSSRRDPDREYYNHALYTSTDGGRSWRKRKAEDADDIHNLRKMQLLDHVEQYT